MENRKFGALWKKINKEGNEFFSGEMIINGKKISIVVFSRGNKKNEKEPDYDILISQDREGLTI